MHPTAVINVVGLTRSLLGPDTPHLNALAAGGSSAALRTITPAVTCSVQATMVTGTLPRDHGVVGNGWYLRDLAQVMFWRQENQLISGDKLWDTARRRDPSVTCAKMFWWFNKYSSADWSVTPSYSQPANLKDRLTTEIGQFPFVNFRGPNANLRSSEWIAEASLRVDEWSSPSLQLIYLPHLDYNLQRLGPGDPQVREDVRAIDTLCGRLIQTLRSRGRRVIVLSEYGITDVNRPIHLNRRLREAGLLAVREELGTEALDPGASGAFAVADHQVAHIYVRDPRRVGDVKTLVGKVSGVERVLDRREQAAIGLDHARSGDLVAISDASSWFTYYYWLDDRLAPDFARTVDIHRKPGYDPAELFLDPALPKPKLNVAWALARKKLGFRDLLEAIPFDATLVRGSHGRVTDRLDDGPVCLSSEPQALTSTIDAAAVRDLVLSHLFDRVTGRTAMSGRL